MTEKPAVTPLPKKLSAEEILQPDAAGAGVWGDGVVPGVDENVRKPDSDAEKIDAEETSTRFGDWEKKGRCIDF